LPHYLCYTPPSYTPGGAMVSADWFFKVCVTAIGLLSSVLIVMAMM